MSEKRNLDKIISEIEKFKEVRKDGLKYINNSYSVKFLCEMKDSEFGSFANEIIKQCSNVVKLDEVGNNKKRKKDQDYLKRRLKLTFIKRNNKFQIYSNEVFIERLYSFAQNRNNSLQPCWNQYQIGKDYREAIDIFVDDFEQEYIELKALGSTSSADTPLYAIIENLKNYYMTKQREKIKKLVILAPNDYWKNKISNKKCFDSLKKLIKKLNELLKKEQVKIVLEKFDFETSDLDRFVDDIENLIIKKSQQVNDAIYSEISHIYLNETTFEKMSKLALIKLLERKTIVEFSDIFSHPN